MGKVLLLLVLVFVLLAASSGEAATVRVPAERPTIQGGIDAAAPGDTVVVACGTYYEHDIIMKDSVTLRSDTSDSSCVTIDAQSLGRGITCSGLTSATVIKGIKIVGGSAGGGGGMLCENSSPEVVGCAFVSNEVSGEGGGVYCSGASEPVFSDCTFRSNSAHEGGGLCSTNLPCSATLLECVFSHNDAHLGGGVALVDSAKAEFGACRFAHNEALTMGGGILTTGGLCDVHDCVFESNSASLGGGLIVGGPSSCSISFSLFLENSAEYGGALYGYSFSPTRGFVEASNCTFVGNHSIGNGCAMALRRGVFASIDRCIIAFGTGGSAIICEEPVMPYPSLTCCDVYDNAGGDWVGCIADQYLVDGNFSEDPLFCLQENLGEPYSLHEGSLCLPEDSPCGELVGAFGEGCGPVTPVEEVGWGVIKAMFR